VLVTRTSYRSYSKRNIRNIVVFLTTYICTNNFLLFDNTTGMTHLKISDSFCAQWKHV